MSIAVALCMVVVACGMASAGAGPPVKAVVAATGGDGFELTTTKGQMFVGGAKGYIGNTYLMGWRFENIAIPKGAQITSATLDLYAVKGASGAVNVRFYGDSSGDAAAIAAGRYNLSSRMATTATVSATLTSWNKAQTWYKSPDLTAIVQEIVQKPDWQYGNSLAILCANRGTKGKITLYNIEQDVLYAPQLTITYNAPQNAAIPWDIDLDGDTIPDLTLYDLDADGYYELPCGKLEFFGTLTIDRPVEVPACPNSSRGLSIVKGDGIVISSGGIIISDLDSPVVSSPEGTKGNDIQLIGRNFITLGAGANIVLNGDYEGVGAGDILLQTLRTGAGIILDGKGMINGRSVSVISSGSLYMENGFRAVAAGNLNFQTYSHDIRLMHSTYADATLISGTATISFKTESGSVYLVDNVELASDFIDMTKVKGTVHDDGTTTVLGVKLGW